MKNEKYELPPQRRKEGKRKRTLPLLVPKDVYFFLKGLE